LYLRPILRRRKKRIFLFFIREGRCVNLVATTGGVMSGWLAITGVVASWLAKRLAATWLATNEFVGT
jgi:hypothetical protein